MFGSRKTESTVVNNTIAKERRDGFIYLDEYVPGKSGETTAHYIRASLVKRFKQADPDDTDNGTFVYLFDGTELFVKDDCLTISELIDEATA